MATVSASSTLPSAPSTRPSTQSTQQLLPATMLSAARSRQPPGAQARAGHDPPPKTASGRFPEAHCLSYTAAHAACWPACSLLDTPASCSAGHRFMNAWQEIDSRESGQSGAASQRGQRAAVHAPEPSGPASRQRSSARVSSAPSSSSLRPCALGEHQAWTATLPCTLDALVPTWQAGRCRRCGSGAVVPARRAASRALRLVAPQAGCTVSVGCRRRRQPPEAAARRRGRRPPRAAGPRSRAPRPWACPPPPAAHAAFRSRPRLRRSRHTQRRRGGSRCPAASAGVRWTALCLSA